MFEMLVGYPPFCSDSPQETYRKVMAWKDTLLLPPEATISRESEDLIRQLCSDAKTRIGRDGISQMKKHPFFDSFLWDAIRNEKAPIDPKVKSIDDTSNFDDFPDDDGSVPEDLGEVPANDKDWVWYNYTYKRFEGACQHLPWGSPPPPSNLALPPPQLLISWDERPSILQHPDTRKLCSWYPLFSLPRRDEHGRLTGGPQRLGEAEYPAERAGGRVGRGCLPAPEHGCRRRSSTRRRGRGCRSGGPQEPERPKRAGPRGRRRLSREDGAPGAKGGLVTSPQRKYVDKPGFSGRCANDPNPFGPQAQPYSTVVLRLVFYVCF